jgi:hypothetical protein
LGEVLDFVKYREKAVGSRIGAKWREGIYLETAPPFIIFKEYRGGVIGKEWRLISEYMLRELLNTFP